MPFKFQAGGAVYHNGGRVVSLLLPYAHLYFAKLLCGINDGVRILGNKLPAHLFAFLFYYVQQQETNR